MSGTWSLFVGALTFGSTAFDEQKSHPAALRRALALAAVVGLAAGAGLLFSGLLGAFRPQVAEAQFDDAVASFEESLRSLRGDPGMQVFVDYVTDSLRMGLEIEALPRPLPRSAVRVVETIGEWIGSAAGLMGSWFGYTLAAYFAARAFGGRGSLPAMLALTGLSLAPYAFGILGSVPGCGQALSIGLWAWSSAIFVRGTAAAHEFSLERALAAWALPGLLLFSLGLMVGLLAVLLIAAAAAGLPTAGALMR